MHNGNGHGNGKRWLLIGLVILGGFWLLNDAYRDGYMDALIQTGQVANVRRIDGGPDFPWGWLILAGLGYFAYRKGWFDRFSGPDSPFGPGRGSGGRGIQRYDAPGQGFAPGFRGPRAVFEDWHRQAHAADRAQYAAPRAPQAPPAPPAGSPGHGNGNPPGGYSPAPPPPPPAPDYWTSMPGAANNTDATAQPAAPAATEAPPQQDEAPAGPRGATGPTLEQW